MATEPLRLSPIIYKATDPNNSTETVQKIYDEWAQDYDKDNLDPRAAYVGPEMTVNKLEKVFQHKEGRVLDIGAGTGLLGKILHERGYTNIDALDANKNMLKEARKLNIYKNFVVAFLGSNKLDIGNDTYDAVVGCGIFTPGYVTWNCFDELCRITKTGGIVLIISNARFNGEKNHFYAEKLQEAIVESEKRGKWKRESHEYVRFQEYSDGSLSILRVLPDNTSDPMRSQ